MTAVVITPPAALLDLDLAKEHLGEDSSDHDAYISAVVAAVIGWLDGPAGWLGRALGRQTLEVRADDFPRWCSPQTILLPYPPIVSVSTVIYTDSDGADQTLSSSVYRLIGASTLQARLELAYSQAWPTARCQAESVRVRYVAGYGTAWSDLPLPIRHAILLMVGDLYANRETVGGSLSGIPMPTSADALLSPYRVCAV